MKGMFKSKPKTPAELVRQTRDLLIYADHNTETRESKREEKMSEISKLIIEMKIVLYGNEQSEPLSDACAQLTMEFFKEDILRLLIVCLPKLKTGTRQDAAHVVANLQKQWVNSRLIASDYMENNMDLMDILIPGYEDSDIALTYGAISRDCLRHQSTARYVLESEHMKKFFDYIQIPNFNIASDATATFKVEVLTTRVLPRILIPSLTISSARKSSLTISGRLFYTSDKTNMYEELLTRHKSTVAEFLSTNYDWFFPEYNSRLLESSNYITRRHAVKLLGDMLLDRSNSAVMIRFVSSLDNMRILMNLFRDSNKTIQLETFHVFKLFVANQNKPPEIVSILITNRNKLLRFFGDFNIDREDEQFEADKAQVVEEIATLEPRDPPCEDLDNV